MASSTAACRATAALGVHHHAQYKENAERDQNKVQNGLDPCSPQDSNLGNRFDTLGGFHALAEHGLDIIQIGSVCQQTDAGVDDVIDKTCHDFSERTADDDTDCHIHYVSACDKRFEI